MNQQVNLRVTIDILTNLDEANRLLEKLPVSEEVTFNCSDELTSHNIENMEIDSMVMFDKDEDINLLE